MRQFPTPIEDNENPCYCPSISALSYLQSLRRPLVQKNANTLANKRSKSRHSKSARFARMLSQVHCDLSPSDAQFLLPSFSELLNDSMNEEDLLMLQNAAEALSVSVSMDQDHDDSRSSFVDSAYFAHPQEKTFSARVTLSGSNAKHKSEKALKTSNRSHGRDLIEVSSAFSDLKGPAQHQRSSVSVNANSFELSAKADKLNFFPPRRKSQPKEWVSPHASNIPDRVQVGVLTASEARRKMRRLEGKSTRCELIMLIYALFF